MNKDKTGNERQARRREREKEWLRKHGYESWAPLHTALMNNAVIVVIKGEIQNAKAPKQGPLPETSHLEVV